VSTSKSVIVCQNRTCRKQGAVEVLAAFQNYLLPNVAINGSGCLGHCGSGPMVLILPDGVWYNAVDIEAVTAIAQQHLLNGK